MKKKPERDYRFFEEWARRHGMKPVERIVGHGKDPDILIADSGVLISEPSETDLKYFYRTGFAIDWPGWGVHGGSYNDYDPSDFFGLGFEEAKKARTDEAIAHAREQFRIAKEVGLYDSRNLVLH